MHPRPQDRLLSVALALAVATSLAACGATATTTPAQEEARQQIVNYVEAFNKAGSHFHSAPTAQQLRTAIGEIASTVPPAQFRASYERFLGGLRGELAGFAAVERAERIHNATLIKKAELAKLKQAAIASSALAEAGGVLKKCQQDNYSC